MGSYMRPDTERLLSEVEGLANMAEPAVVRADLTDVTWVSPTFVSVVVACLRRATAKGLVLPGSEVLMPTKPGVLSYVERMGFIEILTGGTAPRRITWHEPVGFRECTAFDSLEASEAVSKEMMGAVRERCFPTKQTELGLHVSLCELTNNVVHHAESPCGGFAAAQSWPKLQQIEVVIVDLGRGVRASLTSNPRYAGLSEDRAAIEAALRLGVTATPSRNSGQGLYFASEMLRENGGEILVRSGCGAVYAGSRHLSLTRETHFPGTVVSVLIRMDRPLDWGGVARGTEPKGDQIGDDELFD